MGIDTELERCMNMMDKDEAIERINGLLESLPVEAARRVMEEVRLLTEDARRMTASNELGTPGKMGVAKYYYDPQQPEEANEIMKSAVGASVNFRREYELRHAELTKELQGGV